MDMLIKWKRMLLYNYSWTILTNNKTAKRFPNYMYISIYILVVQLDRWLTEWIDISLARVWDWFWFDCCWWWWLEARASVVVYTPPTKSNHKNLSLKSKTNLDDDTNGEHLSTTPSNNNNIKQVAMIYASLSVEVVLLYLWWPHKGHLNQLKINEPPIGRVVSVGHRCDAHNIYFFM